MKHLMGFAALITFLLIPPLVVAPGDAYALAGDAAMNGEGAEDQWEHPDWDTVEEPEETDAPHWQSEDADAEVWGEEYEEVWESEDEQGWDAEDVEVIGEEYEGYEEYEEVE